MQNKIEKNIIKNKRMIVILFIIISVSTFAFNVEVGSNDELWNFSNIYKMTNGETIYKDCNVIITPLFFYLEVLIFKIFGSNYLVFRISNVFIFTMFYILIYNILSKLEVVPTRKFLYLISIIALTYGMITSGANYNILAINFALLGVLLILKEKNNLWQGLIIFLTFMTKQNIGIYYAIGYIIYTFIDIENKNFLKAIKKMLPSFLITIILLGMYIIYLFLNHNLYSFINYAFLGISEFGSKNFGLDRGFVFYYIIVILIDCIILWMISSKLFKISRKIKNTTIILASFSIPMLLVAYPLINSYHINLAIILSIIIIIYFFEKNFLEELLNNSKMKKITIGVNIVCVIGICLMFLLKNINYLQIVGKNPYDIYYGGIIREETQNSIEEMLTYIKQCENDGKEVKVISYKSNLYMNLLKRNNGDMDLPFYGNLGREGEDGLIEKIKKLKDTNLLISKEEDEKYQESKKVRTYIINNYELIGEIDEFLIYRVGY